MNNILTYFTLNACTYILVAKYEINNVSVHALFDKVIVTLITDEDKLILLERMEFLCHKPNGITRHKMFVNTACKILWGYPHFQALRKNISAIHIY